MNAGLRERRRVDGDPIPYPATPPTSRDQMPSNGVGSLPLIWPRLGARIIDELIWAVPMNAFLVYLVIRATGSFDFTLADVPRWALVVTAVVPVVYEFVCLVVFGATFGKWALGLRVVNYATGGRPLPYQMGLRVVVVSIGSLLGAAVSSDDLRFLFTFITPVLLFSVTADPISRGLHDKGAGTIVVRSR